MHTWFHVQLDKKILDRLYYGSLVIVKSTQYNNLAPMLYGQVSGQITIMGFAHACRGAIGLKAFSVLFFVKMEKNTLFLEP